MYDLVHQLGRALRDSKPTYDEDGNYYAPKTSLSKDAQAGLESRIKSLAQRNNRYLDQCGIIMPEPL